MDLTNQTYQIQRLKLKFAIVDLIVGFLLLFNQNLNFTNFLSIFFKGISQIQQVDAFKMSDKFQDKLQLLNNKLSNMQQPCSVIQRQSKCKDQFLNIRRKIEQKIEALEKDLKHMEHKVEKQETKIKHTKQTVNSFSNQKHSQLQEIIENWVESFKDKVKNAKQGLKSYEVATDVKLNELQKDNLALMENLQQKIRKNLKKVDSSMESLSKKCQQQRDMIKKEFEINKNKIQKLVYVKDRKKEQLERTINSNFFEIQLKINTQIQLLTQKWIKKDEKTKKILELLIQSDDM